MTSDGKRVQTLIKVLRKGLDYKEKSDLSLGELNAARTVASAHGLSAIAYDGLEKALDSNPERRNEIPKTLLLQWYGQCVHQTALFKKKWKAACSLSSLLGEHGIEAVVLKGRSIAQYYPIPEHRYSCDLDFSWLVMIGNVHVRFLRRKASYLSERCIKRWNFHSRACM